MASVVGSSQQPWRKYYALRKWARLSLLALSICLYLLLVKPPEMLLDKLNNLPDSLKVTVVFVGIGIATILFAAPVLKWAEWRCPRCGEKFEQPKMQLGTYYLLLLIAWRLVLGRHCATCGADLGQPNFDH
jgi:hypothetical protein